MEHYNRYSTILTTSAIIFSVYLGSHRHFAHAGMGRRGHARVSLGGNTTEGEGGRG
jgi:hypothetical protein